MLTIKVTFLSQKSFSGLTIGIWANCNTKIFQPELLFPFLIFFAVLNIGGVKFQGGVCHNFQLILIKP